MGAQEWMAEARGDGREGVWGQDRDEQALERQTFLNSHHLVVKSWKGFSREEKG